MSKKPQKLEPETIAIAQAALAMAAEAQQVPNPTVSGFVTSPGLEAQLMQIVATTASIGISLKRIADRLDGLAAIVRVSDGLGEVIIEDKDNDPGEPVTA